MWHTGLADKCDRCGEIYLRLLEIELPFKYKVRTEYFDKTSRSTKGYEYIDLCPKCLNELAEWFEKGVVGEKKG